MVDIGIEGSSLDVETGVVRVVDIRYRGSSVGGKSKVDARRAAGARDRAP